MELRSRPERSDGPPPSATVVLPTYRRPEGVARVLRCLAQQIDPGIAWDVVVVNNDATSTSIEEIVTSIARQFPAPLRLVHEERAGSAYARNRGVDQVGGSIVVFVDDDVRPEPAWLRELVAPILAGRCEGTGGRVLVDPSVPRPWWYREEFDWHLAEVDFGDEESDVVLGYVVTASAAFRLDTFRSTGGFDPALGPRRGVPLVNDDVAICRKFIAAGGRIRYVPSALVIHDLPTERLRVRYMLRRFYAQGRSDWILEALEATRERPESLAVAMRKMAYHLRVRFRAAALRSPVWAICEVAWTLGFMREVVRGRIGSGRARER